MLYCGWGFQGGSREVNIEHVFAAAWMKPVFGCPSRDKCRQQSLGYNRMEADLHNLYPDLKETNSRRGSFSFGEVPGEAHEITGCDFEVGRGGAANETVAEPRPEARGEVARAVLYMADAYGAELALEERELLAAWDREDPPSEVELARNERIAELQGTRNRFIDAHRAVGGAAPVAAAAARSTSIVPELRVASWNMGWLTERADTINEALERGGGRGNVHQRSAADFALLAGYVERLNADVIALQEVDTVEAAQKVFEPGKYEVILTEEDDFQRPGFVIRRGLSFERNPDLAKLDITAGEERSLRRGADITVTLGARPVRLHSVHLKSGCFDEDSEGEDCDLLERQMPILDGWMDAREAEGAAFAVLGDFNRRLQTEDPLWDLLNDGDAPLLRATAGKAPACWNGRYGAFIDHIIVGGEERGLQASSFEELVYAETGSSYRKRISDHCPVAVSLRLAE